MIRSLDVAATPAFALTRPHCETVVVIDVLRATSTIVTALDHGAAGIIPVRETDEAIAIMRRMGRERVLLCGERNSRLIEGFDLDNSPASFTAERVARKTLVLTTTNGTRALLAAASTARAVYCAALLNRAAIVTRLRSREGAVRLLCSGSEGQLSFEDLLCAGAITDALLQHDKKLAISDEARAAATVFAAHQRHLTAALASGTHAQTLIEAGFAGDVDACARIDSFGCVPVYTNGVITAA